VRPGALLLLLVGACSSDRGADGADGGPPTPDGIPLELPETTSLAASLLLDLDGDHDRDLVAAVTGAETGLRVLRYSRAGRRWGVPEELESEFLAEIPVESIVARGVRVTPVPGFVRVEVRTEEACVEDVREDVTAEVYFPRRRGTKEVFRAHVGRQTKPCPLAPAAFLARCQPRPDPEVTVRTHVHEGAREIELNVEGVTFSVRPVQGRFVGDPLEATRGLSQALAEAERLRSQDAEAFLTRLDEVERLVDLVCRGRGTPGCHGSAIGIPEEARPDCEIDDVLLRVRTWRARTLARIGQARGALRALGQPVDPTGGVEATALRTARAEVLAAVAPSNAVEIGRIPRCRPPHPSGAHRTGPFAWTDEDRVVYVAGGSERQTVFGSWKAGIGDVGMLPAEDRWMAAKVRAEIVSTDGTHAVVAADRFGVFVCRRGDEERSCRAFAERSLGRESGARCGLVDEVVRAHDGARIVLDPCAGATDPVPLGFVDGDRLAVVAAGSAEPVLATAETPAERAPMPRGPSPSFAGTDFLPDGSARLVWTGEGTFLVPRGGGAERRVLPPGETLRWITVSPSGRRFVALEGERGARVWRLP